MTEKCNTLILLFRSCFKNADRIATLVFLQGVKKRHERRQSKAKFGEKAEFMCL